jgi:hypothetical protein
MAIRLILNLEVRMFLINWEWVKTWYPDPKIRTHNWCPGIQLKRSHGQTQEQLLLRRWDYFNIPSKSAWAPSCTQDTQGSWCIKGPTNLLMSSLSHPILSNFQSGNSAPRCQEDSLATAAGAAVAVAHPLRAREAAGAGEGSHIRSPSLVQRGSTGSTGSTHPDVHLVLRSITVWARGASKGTQKLNGSQVSLALCHNRPSKTTALPDARGKHVQKTAVLLKPKKLLACSMKLCIVGATWDSLFWFHLQ